MLFFRSAKLFLGVICFDWNEGKAYHWLSNDNFSTNDYLK